MFESAMQDRVLVIDGVYTITGSECDADCFDSDEVLRLQRIITLQMIMILNYHKLLSKTTLRSG